MIRPRLGVINEAPKWLPVLLLLSRGALGQPAGCFVCPHDCSVPQGAVQEGHLVKEAFQAMVLRVFVK